MSSTAFVAQMNIVPTQQILELDFKGVSQAASAGIVEWLRLIYLLKHKFVYSHCPPWLVSHFNSISDFLPPGRCSIRSVFVPFFCESEDVEEKFLFHVGKDLPLQASYAGFNVPDRQLNGHTFVCDVTPKTYFSFLQIHHENFALILKDFEAQR